MSDFVSVFEIVDKLTKRYSFKLIECKLEDAWIPYLPRCNVHVKLKGQDEDPHREEYLLEEEDQSNLPHTDGYSNCGCLLGHLDQLSILSFRVLFSNWYLVA